MDVRTLSDPDLLLGTQQVLGSRRQLTAKLLLCLGEIEARNLHLKEAYASMYDYCVTGLAMSEGEAHRTLAGARVGRRFPAAIGLLRDGLLHLSGLELLHTHLTQDNHGALLEAACRKTKRQIEELIRAHFPRPDVPSRIQPLLVGRDASGEVGAQTEGIGSGACGAADAVDCVAQQQSLSSPNGGNSRLRPLSADRFHVQFTAGREFRDKLERVQDFMRHKNPRGGLEPIFERALDLLVADLEKKRLAKTDRPRRAKPPKHGAISRAARRQVYERDGERCTYVSPSGRRCTSRAFVELDHSIARALGGSGEPKNLRVRCGAHNRFEAMQVFGEQHVNDKIEERRQVRCGKLNASEGSEDVGSSGASERSLQFRARCESAVACDEASTLSGRRDEEQDTCNLRQQRSGAWASSPKPKNRNSNRGARNPVSHVRDGPPGGNSDLHPRNRVPHVDDRSGDDRGVYLKLLRALAGMGFRQRDARRALDAMRERRSGGRHALQLDEMLKEALAILTR